MAENTVPIWGKTPKIGSVLVTAANTSSQGGGTIATDIFLAATMGVGLAASLAASEPAGSAADDTGFWVALVAAVGVRLMRWRLAKVLDHQHERCVSCRFDLRGTATTHGEGTCPECGGRFARTS